MRIEENDEISEKDFAHFGLALECIIKTASRGLRYGLDMKSSRFSCLEDVRDMAARTLSPEALKVPTVDHSRPLHVEAAQEGTEKFYVVVTAQGNFFAKTYSHADAVKIAEVC